MIIGITGSIAEGKSYWAKRFHHDLKNSILIDCDEIIKNLNLFKKEESQTAFDSKENLRKLELHSVHIVFKHVSEKILNNMDKYIILDFPLLFEYGLNRFCDYTICVIETNSDLVYDRILKRGWSEEEYLKRMSFQMNRLKKLNLSDFKLVDGLNYEEIFERLKVLKNEKC